MKIETKSLDRDEFIHLLADRAGFTLADTKIFFKAIEDIFLEAVQSKVELRIRGFGDLYYTTIAERTVSRGIFDNEPKHYPEVTKVVFRLSEIFRNVLKVGYGKLNK